MAVEASARAGDPNQAEQSQIGEVLAANIAGGFALELALKLFYMTFHEQTPPRGHNLDKLWKGLPNEWRNDMARNYARDPRAQAPIMLFAFRRSPQPPDRPDGYEVGEFASADGLFVAIADIFCDSRYFYERVTERAWAHVAHPMAQMSAMLDVLVGFYDHLLRVGKPTGSPPA